MDKLDSVEWAYVRYFLSMVFSASRAKTLEIRNCNIIRWPVSAALKLTAINYVANASTRLCAWHACVAGFVWFMYQSLSDTSFPRVWIFSGVRIAHIHSLGFKRKTRGTIFSDFFSHAQNSRWTSMMLRLNVFSIVILL